MNDGLNFSLFLFHSLINVYKLIRGENGWWSDLLTSPLNYVSLVFMIIPLQNRP